MRYDIDVIRQLCRELGLTARLDANQILEIDLGEGAVLTVRNAERDEDCLIGFVGTPWHTHDNLMFADGCGNSVELDYLDLIVGLKEGRVLICEQQIGGQTVDRWLIHRDCNDEFKYLEENERILVRRAATNTPG